MLIAIDGYEANTNSRVGIGRYAYEILKGIYNICSKPQTLSPKPSFRIYLPEAPRDDMPPETPWWQYRVVPFKKYWTFLGFPVALMLDAPHPDVVFSPTHYIPRFIPFPRVCSVMDVSYLTYPELFKAKDLYQLTHWTAYSLGHVRHVCTISEFTRSAIIQAYKLPQSKVSVTYPGFTKMSSTTMTKDTLTAKYHISKNYILSVGTIQPRKNYERLMAAFALFLTRNKQKFGTVDLVIVGKKGWMYEKILETPKNVGLGNQIKFLDFIPDEDLPGLYTHALCFVLPSLYEGFGLPVLEAMAYKCPVVVSKSSSLPEIAGKAGVYVDPMSTESIAGGMLVAVRERNIKQGKWRVAKGLEQVKQFSWETAAKQTLAILEEVGKSSI